jgi:Tfp pilus assembly protein PilX
MKTRIYSENGFATLIALLLVGMLMLIGLAAINMSDDEISIAGNELQEMRAFYAAESGLEQVASALQAEYDSTGLPPTILPSGSDSLNHAQIVYSSTDDGAATQRVLTVGTLAGLHALVKSFTMTATATSTIDRAKAQMSQSFETALVPIFQFAVFYGQDLEIDPGPNMTLLGRVHSNGNMYLNPAGTVSMDSYVTASGEILVASKGTDPLKGGTVRIKDASGTYRNLSNGSVILDHTKPNWYDSSIARWNGRVQDEAHGQPELNLPLTTATDAHKVLERATGNPDSYENKSTLKIVEGVALKKQSDGTWLDVTANMVADGAISYTANKFWDDRELKWVDATELDIAKMYSKGYAPTNGVLYFSDTSAASTEWPALRVKNGTQLDAGLTIACQNPVYTLGNFNTTNKKPACILSDAMTVLSGSWNDANSNKAKSFRSASNTTVNVSYMTGGVETGPGVESGGFHNLMRLLETWGSTKTLTWKGSSVHMWYSRQATATWREETGGYYTAPTRSWSYDTDLDDPSKLPPETPCVRVFQRTGWKQDFVSLSN